MKLQLDKNEVYTAVQAYLYLKGFMPTGTISQKYTNSDGLLYLDVDVERHNKSGSEAIAILKQQGII